ncbi:MAG: hypothetical protein AB4426_29405 [Xenococcaceae cyanobacterium]
MKLKPDYFPWLIILTGVLLTLFLFVQVQGEVFFSGDGGLKALLAKQLSSGDFHFDLKLPAESWVQQLWNNGLYPFEPPFVYKQADVYYITFPFTFPLVTAPFYALFGWKGLYIIPLVSTWVVWLGFYWVCDYLKLGFTLTSVALSTLIFAAPLSMYSVMYWEHTLAVSLAFNGLAIIIVRGQQGFSTRDALLSGMLIGLSVWFRPEFLCLVGILFVLVTASYKLNLGSLTLLYENKTIFLMSMIITVLFFLGINTIIYTHPLGIHALQVVEEFSPRGRLYEASKISKSLNNQLFKYFSIIYFPMIYVGISIFTDQIKFNPLMRQLLLISITFMFTVPLIVPSDGGKQWGPRFLLILMPLISLLAIMALKSTWRVHRLHFKYISIVIFASFFIHGFYTNTYLGTQALLKQGFLTVINFVEENTNKVVAVPHQYLGQSLGASIFEKKKVFLIKEKEDFLKLGQALPKNGYEKFLYICPHYHSCFSSEVTPKTIEFILDDRLLIIEFSEVLKLEKYIFYEALVIENSGTTEGSFSKTN